MVSAFTSKSEKSPSNKSWIL